jgi:hypothetical protein
MGALFIGSVLLFPAGIVGAVQQLSHRLSRGSSRRNAAPVLSIQPDSTPELRVAIPPTQMEGQS